MKIDVKTLARQAKPQPFQLTLKDRLPRNVAAANRLTGQIQAVVHGDCYLLSVEVEGQLLINCQRCLEEFNYDYQQQTQLAVCQDEETAEKWMTQYESLVVTDNTLDLEEIVTDDLYLYAPEKHPHLEDCRCEIG